MSDRQCPKCGTWDDQANFCQECLLCNDCGHRDRCENKDDEEM